MAVVSLAGQRKIQVKKNRSIQDFCNFPLVFFTNKSIDTICGVNRVRTCFSCSFLLTLQQSLVYLERSRCYPVDDCASSSAQFNIRNNGITPVFRLLPFIRSDVWGWIRWMTSNWFGFFLFISREVKKFEIKTLTRIILSTMERVNLIDHLEIS